jgi:hypothetical protein
MTVGGFLRPTFGGWRGVEINMRSPLPVDVARERLRAGVAGRFRVTATFDSAAYEGRQIVGRIGDDGSVRLEAGSITVRNSWRPIAHGDLRRDGTGSRLSGTLRVPPLVRVFSVLWLGFACLFFVITAAATIVTLATGHTRDVGDPATILGIAVAMVVFGGGLVVGGSAFGRRDGDFLLVWLAEKLEVTRQHQP